MGGVFEFTMVRYLLLEPALQGLGAPPGVGLKESNESKTAAVLDTTRPFSNHSGTGFGRSDFHTDQIFRALGAITNPWLTAGGRGVLLEI